MAEADKTGWNIYEPSRCECVSTKVGSIKVAGGISPVFILELITLEGGATLIKYFNVYKTPKGDYSVKHNSAFAKLYRLTLGVNPKARYTRADQLLRHLEGYEFIAEYEDASTNQIEHYLKVKKLEPVNPVITNEWFASGTLKAKKKGLRYNKTNANSVTKDKQQVGNELAKTKQKIGNDLAMTKGVNPNFNLGLDGNSTSYKSLKHDIEPLPHTGTHDIDNEYKTSIKIINGANIFQYHKRPDETEVEYHERVINESLVCYGGFAGG